MSVAVPPAVAAAVAPAAAAAAGVLATAGAALGAPRRALALGAPVAAIGAEQRAAFGVGREEGEGGDFLADVAWGRAQRRRREEGSGLAVRWRGAWECEGGTACRDSCPLRAREGGVQME